MVSKRLALLALSVSLFGCRAATDNTPNYSLSGNWRQSGQFTDSATGDSHIPLGSFNLTQTAGTFSGTGHQTGACVHSNGDAYNGPLSDGQLFQVTSGLVNAMQVSFKTNICTYQGSFEHGNPNRITGTGFCTYTVNGTDYHFTGTWQADRQ